MGYHPCIKKTVQLAKHLLLHQLYLSKNHL